MREKVLKKSIEIYNKYRSPLATAELIQVEEDRFKVRFEGSFCFSCGMDEYLMDFVYILNSKGFEAELSEFRSKDKEELVAEYKILN
ncbi:hypothetical protein AKJ51_03110 [candidate division MSBL1 archaeon SCGC-AAA382A20]|uniref:NIF system FeS cluster assembly NifU C-terminal domain-containing protein n=1 Tax=candidate division MSBL1 archaeon SCGC-AAA382A20 TaxID=1698280 RepID=A0A133VJT3_9EURY|nr:hypothetical protein AKJ51_03110 [candidate division MSBL1 archaeon SCGC-AAA382A20]